VSVCADTAADDRRLDAGPYRAAASLAMRILIATDGLPPATHAIHESTRLLASADAETLVVSVLDPELHTGGNLDADADIAAALAILAAHGIEARGEVLRGRYADAIVAKAEAFDADVVVVGAHRSSRLLSLLMGSVSDEVIRRFRGAVLVVHHGEA
jgi:nucleotide-binding universal stress UspA family protein